MPHTPCTLAPLVPLCLTPSHCLHPHITCNPCTLHPCILTALQSLCPDVICSCTFVISHPLYLLYPCTHYALTPLHSCALASLVPLHPSYPLHPCTPCVLEPLAPLYPYTFGPIVLTPFTSLAPLARTQGVQGHKVHNIRYKGCVGRYKGYKGRCRGARMQGQV